MDKVFVDLITYINCQALIISHLPDVLRDVISCPCVRWATSTSSYSATWDGVGRCNINLSETNLAKSCYQLCPFRLLKHFTFFYKVRKECHISPYRYRRWKATQHDMDKRYFAIYNIETVSGEYFCVANIPNLCWWNAKHVARNQVKGMMNSFGRRWNQRFFS